MHLILFDDSGVDNLLPLTFTRPAGDLRVGILTIKEKWEENLGLAGFDPEESSFLTREYLMGKYPVKIGADNLLINASLLPNGGLIMALNDLAPGNALKKDGKLLALRCGKEETDAFRSEKTAMDRWLKKAGDYDREVSLVEFPWDIFSLNGQEISEDFELLSLRGSSEALDHVQVFGKHPVYVEAGFKGSHFTLNTTHGPVYLGRDSEIMEGSLIRGPFALCEGAGIKLGAKIYGPTTIGPHCKAGGELNNVVMHSHSNKGHDGFLGNAVIGEWCNLGADTNNSNLKNNYSEVKVWNYPKRRFIRTGLQFCGLIMGDHSKCGINTMFNTGTVVGVSANIFGAGFPRNFIPSFSWGGAQGMSTYRMEKVLETARLVMERRGREVSDADREILQWVFDHTEDYRKW